jgi:murein DD-endopeptidase MepM/ murein hydrolase activator NlpD
MWKQICLTALFLVLPTRIKPNALPSFKVGVKPVLITKQITSFIEPAHGRLTSLFGRRNKGFHTGIDIAAIKGSPITATKAGKVTFAGYAGGYGKLVVVQHEKYTSRYAHCSKILVKKNAIVKQGDTIALVGSTGRSTGNHLHFEILLKEKFMNPQKYLTFRSQAL